MMDNTDRTKAEEAKAETQAQLEAANRELKIAYHELEAFSYSVSHDLRQPLRAIQGFSTIIREDYVDKLDDEGKRLLDLIRGNTTKMEQLITGLLALSRVTRIELNFTSIDMTELAKTVYEEIATTEVKGKFNFGISTLPNTHGDLALIRQVWSNLIANAIKYTLPKENCRIEIGSYQEGKLNIYYVRDNGVGFNPQYADKLFRVFQRLHKDTEFEGTGVGLVIVQRIINRHGGSVWAEGALNQGATFYFSIPETKIL